MQALTDSRARHGVVTRAQLLVAGTTVEGIRTLLRRGVLERCYPGVYLVVGAPRSFEQRVVAALAAAGPDAHASHRCAAALHGLRRIQRPVVEITVPRGRLPRLAGVIVHRSVQVGRIPIVQRDDGIRLTSPAATLLDVAWVVDDETLEHAFEDAIHRGLTNVAAVEATHRSLGGPGRPGTARLGRLLRGRAPGQVAVGSGKELALVRALLRNAAPPPTRQHPVRLPDGSLIHVDLAWPDQRLAVEVDWLGWHATREAQARDHHRDFQLALIGWRCQRVTAEQADTGADRTARDLVDLLALLEGTVSRRAG